MFGKIRLLLELQAKINARGHDNSMFSSSAMKPMNRLTQVLKHLTVMVRYRTSDTWVSRKGRHLFTKNDPEHPYKQNKKNSKKQKPVSVEEILRTAL